MDITPGTRAAMARLKFDGDEPWDASTNVEDPDLMDAYAYGSHPSSMTQPLEIVYHATSPECAQEHLAIVREIFSNSPLFNLGPTSAEAFTAGDLVIVRGTLGDFGSLITETTMNAERAA